MKLATSSQSYQAIAKITHDGYTDTVNMFTPMPPVSQHNYSDAIIENNRLLYATPRADVEAYVRNWYDRDDGVPHIGHPRKAGQFCIGQVL